MSTFDLKIIPFTYKHAHLFSRMRRDIDNSSECVLANKGERKENALHVIVRSIISQRRTVTFLAFDNKKDIGYVSIVFPKFTKLQGNAYLTIGLRSEYRGKGIGNTLMNKAEEYAKSRGVRRMELEVFGKNKNAIELYTKRKYEIEGVKKEAICIAGEFDDIIIMAKKLN